MALEDDIKRLEAAMEALDNSFDERAARIQAAILEAALYLDSPDLERLLGTRKPSVEDIRDMMAEHGLSDFVSAGNWKLWEVYGRTLDLLSDYDEIIQISQLTLEYAREEAEFAEDEITERIKSIGEFILEKSFSGQYDSYNAIVSLSAAGKGPSVAERMEELGAAYMRFALRKGWSVDEIDLSSDSWTLKVKGDNAYAYLRGEHGNHRFKYMASGKKHTSYVSVTVEPEIEQPQYRIADADLTVESVTGRGPGGQKVNRTYSGVRITHLPSGIQATARLPSYHQSRRMAMDVLASRVEMHYAHQSQRPAPPEGHFRTYDLMRHSIQDHSTKIDGKKSLAGFFAGNIDGFIYAHHGIMFGY